MLDILFRILLYRSMICNLVLSPSYRVKHSKLTKKKLLCQIKFLSSNKKVSCYKKMLDCNSRWANNQKTWMLSYRSKLTKCSDLYSLSSSHTCTSLQLTVWWLSSDTNPSQSKEKTRIISWMSFSLTVLRPLCHHIPVVVAARGSK